MRSWPRWNRPHPSLCSSCPSLRRIGRDPRTLAAILKIEDAGVEIHGYLKGRQVTLDDEAGEVEAYVDSLVASPRVSPGTIADLRCPSPTR